MVCCRTFLEVFWCSDALFHGVAQVVQKQYSNNSEDSEQRVQAAKAVQEFVSKHLPQLQRLAGETCSWQPEKD